MARSQPAPSKTEAVYDYILERIVSGEFPAGSSLHIGKLASATAVSLIPVREALRRLQADGLVVVEHHRGAHVANVTQRDYEQAMEVLALLEGAATAAAAPFITPDELDQARQYNDEMDAARARDDMHAYHESSKKFHQLLHVHCPNTQLRESLLKGHARVGVMQASNLGFSTPITDQLSEEHREMLRMIADGEPSSTIEEYVRGHRLRTMAMLRTV